MLKKAHLAALTILAAASAFAVSACNTVRGVGEDVRAVGESVSEAADEAEDDLTDNK